jgi:putative colanic acid biosynthesis acetyltransferase WcaF
MLVQGSTAHLKKLLLHEDRRGLEHFIAKHNRYSTLEAMEIYREREKWPGLPRLLADRVLRHRYVKYRIAPKLAVPWFLRFVYMYFIRGGFLDRRPGLTLCLLISTYELFIRAKYLELIRTGGKDPVNINGLAVTEGAANLTADLAASGFVAPTVTDAPPSVVQTLRFESPWTPMENFKRALWMFVRALLFRPSFHNWYAWRRFLLRLFGAKLGRGVRIRPTTAVEIPWNLDIADNVVVGDYAILYSLGKITIGQSTMISQYAHLCAGTHDYTTRRYPVLRPPIVIGQEAWIAADAFIGPGVTIGDRAVVGARATVIKDVPPDQVVAGPAAHPIKERILTD